MENIILQKTRYLKALLLTLLVGFFAFGASAQVFISSTPPATPWYAGQEATASYEAETFDAGTSFILWDDADNDTQIDEGEEIFGQSTVQDALEEIDFTWPEAGNVNLRLAAFSGNSVTGEVIEFTNADVTTIGTNSGGDFITFDRASARSLTTNAIDLDTSEPVVLSFTYDGAFASGPDADNPVEVLYSTDGFATAGTALTDDNLAVDEFEDIFQVLEFTLPNAAKTANTSFRIQQTGTVNYDTDKNWQVRTSPAAGAIQVEIGDTYTNIADEFVDNNNVLLPELTINNVLDADDVPGGNIYPGDNITVEAELQGIDLTGLDFAVTISNNDGQRYLLENQNETADNGTKEIEVVGDVPEDIMYDNGNQWDVDIYAYEGSEIQFGVSEFYNFGGGLPIDFEQIGGFQDGSGLTFNEAGERSVTTIPYDISSTDGSLIFTLARGNNVLSPEGTDIIVEYSTDGETFTELSSIPLNSLSTAGTKDTLDAWPAGVVSNSTQFRFRQEGNNGADLDVFVIQDLEIQNNTNIVSAALIGRTFATDQVNVYSPFIVLDNINIGGDGQAFPMEDYTLTYSIDNGTFPANTPATAYLQRTGQPDIIIGETTNVNGESIDFTVPPIEAGDYTIYFSTLNEQEYFGANLAVYDLGLEITSIEYNDPVMVGEDEFTYAGSAITANYTIQGTPGSGAELMMSVYDNNPDVDDWVMIGSSTTLDGTITATLPLGIDYDNNPDIQLSLSSGGVYTSDFDEEVINQFWYGSSIPFEILESTEGTGDTFISDGFEGSGVRSATAVPFDATFGGRLSLNLYTQANFIDDFDVRLEGSTDGENWEELDVLTFTSGGQVNSFNTDIPNNLWSEVFQFRIIYNEDEAFAFGDNVITWYSANITKPTFLEVVQDDAPFNLIRPSLAVSDYDKTAFVMGEEVSINYNAVGFPASTEYAAVVEQGGEFYVAGTSADEGAGTINAVMPIGFEDEGMNYTLTIVPFEPATAGGDYKQGETIDVDQEDDYLIVSGNSGNNFNQFDFDQTGDRELLTRAFDLSDVSSATLNFDFNNSAFGSFDANANKNTVPRLESSVDGGATFQVVEVYELEEGEEQIYDDGLLYLGQGYSIEIPASLLTEATHFRWSQPLNLGAGENEWRVENISITLNDDNRVPDFIFTDNVNGNNPETINITAPDLNGYTWMQANLDDAVFNGESFDYSWDLEEGFNSEDVDAFPEGTTFTFYLEEGGDYVIDPNTELPYVLGTTTSLGTFEAEVPFYVLNANYNVRMSASIEIDGEDGPMDYYFYGDEESGVNVGSLDVFLRAARLTYEGDENATIYAGQDVTFGIEFENNETNTASVEELYANLILATNEGNLVLATQQGMADITVALPTDVTGTRNFSLEITEDAPIAEVGSILENSDYSNLELEASNFIAGDPQVIEFTSDLFFESDVIGSAVVWANINYNQQGVQNVVFEYSINDGPYQTVTTLGNGNTNIGYFLPGALTDNSGNDNIRYRFRLNNNEADGSSFSVSNFRIDRDYPANNNLFPNLTITGGAVKFSGNSGRRLITTRDFAPEEIADATLLTLEASFDQLPADLTTSQYVVFEYSTDGGTTYTELESYPEMDADMVLSNDGFTYAVTADMKENGVRFRWRQEEAKGDFAVNNINMVFGEVLPFDYINTSQSISSQALIIDAVSAEEGCLDAEVTLDYTIRGRFGADNILTVDYATMDNQINPPSIEGYEFNVTEGSGQVTFAFAGDALSQFDDNANYKFRLSANDETTDNTVNIDGNYSELNYELVAPINTDATFDILNDPLSCSPEDVMISINAADMQDYFLYEIIDGEGTVLGSLVRDPEDPQNEINIGEISASTDLELRITSQSSTESVCNTLVVDEESIEVLQDFELYSYANPDQNWKAVDAGASLNSCENAGEISLSVRRLLENGSTTTTGTTLVEWFRDDLNNQVAIGITEIDDTDMELSGEYFARITTESCVYTTERIQINLEGIPDQPTITVVSGDLASCSSADPVVLEAPEGFEFYLWNNGATTRTITVEDQGSYSVQVSNVPFGSGCSSVSSTSIDVDRYDVPDFKVYSSTTSDFVGVGEVINVCSSTETIFFNEDGSYENNGIVQVIRDGVNYATVEQPDDFIVLTESGVYSFVWNYNSLNVEGCTASSVEFTVNLNDAVDVTPAITVTGDLNSCDPDNEVILEGPDGFANYVWYRDGDELNVNSSSITVTQSGSYTLEVSNTDLNSSCALSNESTPVVLNNVSSDDVFINIDGFGDAVAGQVYDICSNNSTSITISGASGAVVTWFQDGAEYATSTNSNGSVNINTSGAYYAEVAFDGCVFTTPEVSFNVLEVPEDAPTITATGDLTFCDGEGSVILEGPEGFAYYEWLLNGNPLNINGVTNNNTIEVIQNGNYTLQVGSISADGAVRNCLSPVSNSITINSRGLPSLPNVDLFDNSCGEGPITFILTSVSSNVSYQLINAATDQPSGLPVVGNPGGSTFISSDVVSEETTFYIEATNADGSGCTNSNPETATFTYAPNNVTLEVEGAQLIARYNYSGSGSIAAVRWFRDDVLLTNTNLTSAFSGQSSISITDAAEYSVEVEYASGCVVTASSADIDGRVLSNRDAMDMQITSYPNPAQSDITLNVNSQFMGKHEVIVTSMTGQVMMQSSFEKSSIGAEHAMDIANLQEGIYNVQIRHNGLTQNVRIIKK